VRGHRGCSDRGDLALIGPDDVLGPGRRDAAGLLVSWLLRRLFWPLLWFGAIVVVLTGVADDPDRLDPELTSVAGLEALLRSPTTLLLVAAPAVRLASTVLSLVLAMPLASRLQQEADRALQRGPWHPLPWIDRWRLTTGLQRARWTSAVRRRARQRLGRTGARVLVVDLVVLVTGIVLAPVAVAVLASGLG